MSSRTQFTIVTMEEQQKLLEAMEKPVENAESETNAEAEEIIETNGVVTLNTTKLIAHTNEQDYYGVVGVEFLGTKSHQDISLFEKAWQDKICDKLLITNKDKNEEYPFGLHEKYSVAIPNNLELIDGKFFVSDYGTNNGGCGTIIADHNISKEFAKEIEETTTWTFNKDPNG